MANVTTLDPPATGPLPVQKRQPRGAKPHPEPPPAQPDSKTGHFGKVPGSSVQVGDPEAGTWWEWLDSLSEDEWKRSICYWYRVGPVTDRQAAGKPTSIEKWGGKFDMKTVLDHHGSGRYRFDFCYIAPGSAKYARVAQEFETILNRDSPPKVPLGEWIDHPSNQDWAWAKPILAAQEQERAKAIPNAASEAPRSATEELKEHLELAKLLQGEKKEDFNAAILKLMLENNSPDKQLATLQTLMALAPKPAAAPQDSMQTMFLQFMLEELREARKARNAEPVNPLDQAVGLLTKVKDLFGGELLNLGGAGGGKQDATAIAISTAGDILSKVAEKVTDHLPSILETVKLSKTVDLQMAQIRNQQAPSGQPWAYNPQVISPQPTPPPAPQPPPIINTKPIENVPQSGPLTLPAFFTKYQTVLQRHFQIIVDKFQHEDGYSLQEHLLDREGRNLIDSLRKDATVELLVSMTQQHPAMKETFQPIDKVQLFFKELLSDPDEETEGEDENEAPIVGQEDEE